MHHKVSDEIQCELYQNGIDSIAKFAASATDEADLKQMLKDSFSIDPSASLKLRAQAAGVVVAWKTATLRVARRRPKLQMKGGTRLSPSRARITSL